MKVSLRYQGQKKSRIDLKLFENWVREMDNQFEKKNVRLQLS